MQTRASFHGSPHLHIRHVRDRGIGLVGDFAPRWLHMVLEVFPVLMALPVMLATQRRFPLSTLALVLIAGHALILIVGGHYTYARVPLGEWAQSWFGWTRNDYDKVGHFAQGFVPAILAREVLLRASPLHGSRWLNPLVVCVCLAISASYEIAEWLVAVSTGAAADDFLGTQGDVWDTQSDMAAALLGAVAAVLLFSRVHDRSLRRLRIDSSI
jgi:putative membrane protein